MFFMLVSILFKHPSSEHPLPRTPIFPLTQGRRRDEGQTGGQREGEEWVNKSRGKIKCNIS